jgi:hypothetical protein
MISCRQATASMTEDREGTLVGSRRTWFRAHMLICVHCRRYRRQLEATIAAAKELPREVVPAEVEDRLVAAFRAKNPGSR